MTAIITTEADARAAIGSTQIRGCSSACSAAVVSRPSDRVACAVMTIYWHREELPQGDATMRRLQQIADHPDVLIRSRVSESFFEHLLDAFSTDADLVGRLGEDAVRLRTADLQAAGHGLHMADTALIDIELRLQRGGRQLRTLGMRLYESLLDLGVAEAINLTRSNDLCLSTVLPVYRTARRRAPS